MSDVNYSAIGLREIKDTVDSYIYYSGVSDWGKLKETFISTLETEDSRLAECCRNYITTVEKLQVKLNEFAAKAKEDIETFAVATHENEVATQTNVNAVNENLNNISNQLDNLDF